MVEYHRRYEKDVAAETGSTTQPRSGAGEFDKADVIGRWLLIECKTAPKADSKSYRIDAKDWNKVVQQAAIVGKIPAFAIGFQGLSLTAIETHHYGGFFERIEYLEKQNVRLKRKIKNMRAKLTILEDRSWQG